MELDAKFLPHPLRIGNLRAKNVDLVTPPDHFLDQINGLRRAPARGRIERFVSQEGDADRRLRLAHATTL